MNNYMATKWITWKRWTDCSKTSKQEEIEIMNNPGTSTEIEAVIKNQKAQDHMASQENCVKHLQKS